MKNELDVESIYKRTPIALQNLLVSLEGWRIKRRRYNKKFDKVLYSLTNSIHTIDQNIKQFQREKLFFFFLKAKRSHFWKGKFQKQGFQPKPDAVFDQILELPILAKQETKANVNHIAVMGLAKNDLITYHTSGTTGSGLVFPVTREADHIQWATWWRYRGWHGIKQDTWCGYFGGRSLVGIDQKRPPFWRPNFPGHQVLFSAYHLSEATAADYIGEICARALPWLHGYPSILSLLAKFKLDQGLPECPNLKIITTGAENLLPHQKALLEEAFRVPVRQHYGLAEGVANFSECERGRLHVDEDFAFVEFIPLEGDEHSCRIIGTNWSNDAFPLLRYDTGDIAILSGDPCSCGRPGRIVDRIDGRMEDFLLLPGGERIGRLDHIFKDLIRIREAQILQSSDGSVCLRVVPGRDFDYINDGDRLLTETRKRLGKELKIRIEYFNELPRTSSGKLRFVISELDEGRIAGNARAAT